MRWYKRWSSLSIWQSMRAFQQSCSQSKRWSWRLISMWSSSTNATTFSQSEFTKRDIEMSRMLKARPYFKRRRKQKLAWILSKSDCAWRWSHRLESDTFAQLILKSLTLNLSLRESLPHSLEIYNMTSRSSTTSSSESRSFDWFAASTRISQIEKNSNEEFRWLRLERRYAIDEKPNVAIDSKPLWNKRTRMVRWMTSTKVSKNFSRSAGPPNVCFA